VNIRSKLLVVVLLVLVTTSCIFKVHPASAETNQASELIETEKVVAKAFSAVLGAEKAGANVTSILTQLSDAADRLAQAENSYRSGNLSSLNVNVANIFSIATEITEEAQNLEETASVSVQSQAWSMLAFTVFGITLFLLTLFAVWHWLRRSYIKNLSNANPEVFSK
jgi:hypothetical protein